MAKPASGGRKKTRRPQAADRRAGAVATGGKVRTLIARIPGGLISVITFFTTLIGGLTLAFSFWPADLGLDLACHPTEMVLTATNNGGRRAFIKTTVFHMIAPARFGNEESQEMHTDALEDPFEVDPERRNLISGQPKQIPWRGAIYQPAEAQPRCEIFLDVELANGSHFPAHCTCLPS